MKRVLITGANSYVGTNVEKWLMKEPDKYYVETLDMKDPNWKNFDFSKFDVVFHVAGIAHVSTKKSMKDVYFKVNRDLTIETAIKAKESGVKQFIFMSSMIVYNSRETRITLETKPNPDNFYGLSKLQAEEGILPLQSQEFNVCVLRPPMIYGPGSKGNFPKMVKYAKKTLFFPKYKNKRSFLYIDNLTNCVKMLINSNFLGVFFPQNSEYLCTVDIFNTVASISGKKMFSSNIFNPIIKIMVNIKVFRKIFGDYFYEKDMSSIIADYNVINTTESLYLSIRRGN